MAPEPRSSGGGDRVRVRPYETVDRAGCLALFDANTPAAFAAEERPGFERFLDDPPGPYLVLEDESGSVVACGGWAVEADGRTGALCWGMVHPGRQGEGLGRRLLEVRLEAAARDGRCSAFRLVTAPNAVGFFERMGFRVAEVRPDGHAPGVDAVEMVRDG